MTNETCICTAPATPAGINPACLMFHVHVRTCITTAMLAAIDEMNRQEDVILLYGTGGQRPEGPS